MTTPTVRILTRSQLDDSRWDLSIRQAVNSLPYAYTWYLDAICTKWIALVVGDYDYVMPLPLGRKWGLRYVYQPLFCQQLGVFYLTHDHSIIELMIKTALRKFIFVHLNLNFDNKLRASLAGISIKKNLILTLSPHTALIQKNYSENTLRNIKKAQKAGLIFESVETKKSEQFIDFYLANTAVKDDHFKPRHAALLQRLVHQFMIHDVGRLYLLKNKSGEVCAGLIVVETDTRIIHLMPAADAYARQHGGMHFLIDCVLHHYGETEKIYDFEGSSVDSIARFYEGFGAVTQPFYLLSKSPFKSPK